MEADKMTEEEYPIGHATDEEIEQKLNEMKVEAIPIMCGCLTCRKMKKVVAITYGYRFKSLLLECAHIMVIPHNRLMTEEEFSRKYER